MNVSLCMINYNGAHYLPDSLRAAYAQEPACAEYLVIDNASRDNSLELLAQEFPTAHVVRLAHNYGPARARNVGFQAASFERILFVDNDVVLAPGCLNHLMAALDAEPEAAVAMPRVLYARAPHIIQYDGAFSHFLGLMSLRNADQPLAGAGCQVQPLDSLVTACFLLDRQRWHGADPFDESFFFNYEDHDFGLRTRILGHKILAVPGAHVLHGEGTAGLSLRRGGQYAPLRVYCLIRNRWLILAKNYALRTLLLLAPVLLLYEVFQLVGVVKKGWLRFWLRACWWMFCHTGYVLAKRRQIQQARRVADRVILHNGPIPFTEGLTQNRLEQWGKLVLDRITTGYWQWVHQRL